MTSKNVLYYGDNLEVLQQHVPDGSVDLIYLDPPFNSNANYNVLFAEQDGSRAASQVEAFSDTWHWDQGAVYDFQLTIEKGGRVADALIAMKTLLGSSDMLAYLSMMAPRLIELRRIMKPSAAIYLHCDPTASHYLKILMDSIFGPENFRNEIIWKRTTAHNSALRYGPVHDVIFFYSRSSDFTWNKQYGTYGENYLESKYRFTDERGLYRLSDLTGPGTRNGDSGLPWRGVDPTNQGRHWQIPSYCYDKFQELTGEDLAQYELVTRLDHLDEVGLVHWPDKQGGRPEHKRYLVDMKGVQLQDVWTDIDPINARAAERLGYPTQKPLALLERIIEASSNPGDVILDPFCGCGTAVDAAQRLDRKWIGIDITHLAVNLIRSRLIDTYGKDIDFDVVGEPTDLEGAKQLAASDPYQFQWWALGLVGARPVDEKKGADRGIDGRIFFHDDQSGETKQVILSVKAGHVTVSQLRDLRGVVERDKAAIGVLISMESATRNMRTESADAGYYEGPWGQKYPKLQLLTVEELLAGTRIDMPDLGAMAQNVSTKRAPKVPRGRKQTSPPLFGED